MPRITRYLWLLLLCPILANADAGHTLENTNPAIKAISVNYVAGKDYRELKAPAPTDTKENQIEVAEVFWYGCPHCYHLESVVDGWKPGIAKDVSFIRVPAFFGPNIWKDHAQLYYTLQNMGILEKVHDSIFDEIQNKKNYLKNTDDMAEFLKKRFGVDKQKFEDSYNSIGIVHQLLGASGRVRSYGLTGVPAIVIDGQYVVEPGMAGSLENMTAITDYLIKKVRSEREVAQAKK